MQIAFASEIPQAARAWGYPFPVDPKEIRLALDLDARGFLWFTEVGPGIWALHALAAPSQRGRFLTRRNLRLAEDYLRARGVRHVIAAPLTTGMVDILRRLQFHVTPSGEIAVRTLA